MNRIVLTVWLLIVLLIPQTASAEWAQDGGNPQRTGYSPEEPITPWTWKWSFNGPDSSGGRQNHIYNAPKEARTVVGNGKLFVPAGIRGLYGLQLSNGGQLYNVFPSAFNATPAYDKTTHTLLIGGADGKVYKLNPDTGATIASYTAGSPVNKAVLLVGNFVYAVSDNGQLHKIRIADMSGVWVYSANATAATPPSYSASRDALVYATDDLYVHAVNNSSGSQKWKVKPTPNAPGDPGRSGTTLGGAGYGNQFDMGWPVIAEQNGVVFIRMQLVHDALIAGPNNGRFANTNAENRTWLQQNPEYKNLFALNLDTGTEKFIPAVGYGSTEDHTGGEAYGVMGSQPVVRLYPDGTEVAYIPFRNGQTAPATDYRWSGHMGEMVLNDSTISGLAAGDLRFMRMSRYSSYGGVGYMFIVDEHNPLTMAGNTLIHSHWGAMESARITDRSNSKGFSYTSPIEMVNHPVIIRAQKSCSDKNTTTHFTNCGLSYVTDGGRFWGGPGFWIYWELADPPGWRIGSNNSAGTAYSAGFLPRYGYVTDGYLIVEGNGGDISVLQHSGPIVQPSPTGVVTVTPTSGPNVRNGDANNDGQVNIADVLLILQNWLISTTTILDQFGDGKVNALDFTRVIKQLP